MKFILAEKREMTQKYGPDGAVIPVTKVVAGPCVVTQVKTKDQDGYEAVQLGFGQRRHLGQALLGHLKGLGRFSHLREFQIEDSESGLKVGDRLSAGAFASGDVVAATGTSKGKGFAGVVKRHHFSGSPASHGHKDQQRMPGASGAGGVQHVLKGKRMGGHMGTDRVTVKNLQVVEVNPSANEIFIKGALPGPVGSLILLTATGVMVADQSAPVSDQQSAISPSTEPGVSDNQQTENSEQKITESKPEQPADAQAEAETRAASSV